MISKERKYEKCENSVWIIKFIIVMSKNKDELPIDEKDIGAYIVFQGFAIIFLFLIMNLYIL